MRGRPAARGPLRFLAALVVFLLIGALSVREWIAQGEASPPLRHAAAAIVGHPELLREQLLLDSAIAARNGKGLSAAAADRMAGLAREAPLASEPFLVAGAASQFRDELAKAEALYAAARSRNPRSSAARFLLADLYLRTGRPEAGLAELLALSRLKPGAAGPLGPGLAAYARQPGAVSVLGPLIRSDPSVRQAMLIELAQDPANVDLVLRLAPRRAAGEPIRPWEGLLIEGLVGTSQLARAEEVWSRLTGRRRDGAINDSGFAVGQPLAPFDWAYYAGPAGVVEAARGAGLDVIHYGREPMIAARQLARLSSGRHVLLSRSSTAPATTHMAWRIVCADGPEVARLPVGRPAPFSIPANCPAQWISLEAFPQDPATPLELRIASVQVDRGDAR